MTVKKQFFNPELDSTDTYTEVWQDEYVNVKGEKILVKNHYWRDSEGELWSDFNNPMENIHRSFDAYRKKKGFLSPKAIKQIRESLGYSVREFASKLNISSSMLTQVENNHRIQTGYQDELFKGAPYNPKLVNRDKESWQLSRNFSVNVLDSKELISNNNYKFDKLYKSVEVLI